MAENDYLYAKAGIETCKLLGNYNAVASGCAQAAEEYLKSVAELCLVDDPDGLSTMRTHNLRTLVSKIKEYFPETLLSSKDCKWLGDYYFEARYPGDNFVVVSEEDGLECLRILELIRKEIGMLLEQIKKERSEQKRVREMKHI